MKNKNVIIVAGILFFLLLLFFTNIIGDSLNQKKSKNNDLFKKNTKEKVKMVEIIHFYSKKYKILNKETDRDDFLTIQKLAEYLIINASSGLKLIVSKSLVDKMKRERAVEIIYTIPKEILIKNKIRKKVTKILIPLEGKFAKKFVTIFYGTPEYNSSNVVVAYDNIETLSKIKKILKKYK